MGRGRHSCLLFWQENSTFNALPLLAALQTANVVKGEALSRGHPHQRLVERRRAAVGVGWKGKAVLHLGLVREWALSAGPTRSSCPSHESLLLWAELKKVIAQKPEGLRTLAEEFPGWEAASRWSQALEEVEQSSRPYLKEVQRYEKYRCLGVHGVGMG